MDYTIKAGDNLSKIAQINNTTVGALSSANNIANPNIIQAGQTIKIPTGVANASITNLTNPTQMKGSIQTPPTTPINTDSVSTYASLVQPSVDAATQAYNTQNANYTSIIDQYKQAQAATEGKNLYTQDLSNQQGLQTKTQAVQDLINQINSNNTQGQIQQLDKGKFGGLTVAGGQNIDAEINRQTAIKNLSLGTQLAAAQGNLSLAQDFVDKAVSAKFDDAEKKLTNLKDYLSINQKELERLDTRAYNAQTNLVNAKIKDLETSKKNFTDIQNMIVNASSQNAPASLVAKAQKAATPGEAAMILGQYAGDYYKTELLKNQIATEKAQRAKIYSSIAADNAAATPVQVQSVTEVKPEKFKDASARTLYQTIDGVISAVKDVQKQAVGGNYSGLGYFQGNTPDVMTSNEGIKNRAFLNAVNLKVQQWASGASLTQQQTDMVNKMVPSVNDSDSVVTNKLNALKDYMTNEQKSIANTQGQRVTEPNVFEQAINPAAGNAVPGTSIIKNISGDGNIIFDIPTSTKK